MVIKKSCQSPGSLRMPTNVNVSSGLPDNQRKMFSEYLFLRKIHFQLFALVADVIANKTKRWKLKSMSVRNTNLPVYNKCMRSL